jgi:hypothetical protein
LVLHTSLISFHGHEECKGGDQTWLAVSVTTIRIAQGWFSTWRSTRYAFDDISGKS